MLCLPGIFLIMKWRTLSSLNIISTVCKILIEMILFKHRRFKACVHPLCLQRSPFPKLLQKIDKIFIRFWEKGDRRGQNNQQEVSKYWQTENKWSLRMWFSCSGFFQIYMPKGIQDFTCGKGQILAGYLGMWKYTQNFTTDWGWLQTYLETVRPSNFILP